MSTAAHELLVVSVLRAPVPGVVGVRAVGEVDLSTAPALARLVTQQLACSPRMLVLDLSEVAFLGACGLSVLAEAARVGVERGIAVRLVAVARPVLRPLQITGLDGLIPTHRSWDSALIEARSLRTGCPADGVPVDPDAA